MTVANSPFRQILRGMGGETGVAVLISAYFDESAENDSQNGLLAVSGYVLDLDGVNGLIPEWQALLGKYRLPHFHMVECNVCKGVFCHLSDSECDLCAREAIRIARAYPLHGHAVVLDQGVYRQILQNEGFGCDPYTFMVWTNFIHVNKWVHHNRPTADISLFFEQGYRTQSRANELLQAISADKIGGKENRVIGHAFVAKEKSEPTQAADLIAWHIRKGYENKRNDKPVRGDTRALFDDRKILTIEYTAAKLAEIRDDFKAKAGSLKAATELLFS